MTDDPDLSPHEVECPACGSTGLYPADTRPLCPSCASANSEADWIDWLIEQGCNPRQAVDYYMVCMQGRDLQEWAVGGGVEHPHQSSNTSTQRPPQSSQ